MKKYHGIDYAFRPSSYWDDTNPLSAILRNVTGENRRQMIIAYWDAGKIEELDAELLETDLGDETRERLGQIHPSFMGGEYLPLSLPGEVEIARICLRSTTADVISLRARPVGAGISYRVVDEYEGEFSLPIVLSESPLSLAEIVKQFDEGRLSEMDAEGGLALGFNNGNAEDGDFERFRDFTRITSTHYPQLNLHFEQVYDDWLRDSCASRDNAAELNRGAAQ